MESDLAEMELAKINLEEQQLTQLGEVTHSAFECLII